MIKFISLVPLSTALVVLVIGTGVGIASALAKEMAVAGYIENAWLEDKSIVVKAKLDTGAENSSIHAPNFRTFKRGRDTWVRFRLAKDNGEAVDIERPVVRTARIRRSGADVDARPVIELDVCVAGVTARVEFNLANRSRMNYPVLIGRSFLAGRILVDSGQKFVGSRKCR